MYIHTYILNKTIKGNDYLTIKNGVLIIIKYVSL